jgi:DNA-directed RNA polymerase beta subunit
MITSGYSSKAIIELLRTVFFMELLSECMIEYIAHSTKIFVNGAWVGIVTKPVEVIDLLKKYRRIGLIPIYTSISWSVKEYSIYIYTDSGRLTRPVLYLVNNKLCYENEYVYNKLYSNDYTYNELLIGFNKFKSYNSEKREVSFSTSDVINSNNVFFNLNEQDLDLILIMDPRWNHSNNSFNSKQILRYLTKINPRVMVVHRINECDERKNTNFMNKITSRLPADCFFNICAN